MGQDRDKRANPTENPREMFREAVKDVQPLRPARRSDTRAPRPVPRAKQRERDDAQVLIDSLSDVFSADTALDIGEGLAYVREGVPKQTLRKLRSGQWALQDKLDLHGMRSEQARAMLAAFLSQCVRLGLRCVLIVHGKGTRSPNGEPVLKRRVAHWLAQRDEVLAFIEARPADGGAGACSVLLRTKGRRTLASSEDDWLSDAG